MRETPQPRRLSATPFIVGFRQPGEGGSGENPNHKIRKSNSLDEFIQSPPISEIRRESKSVAKGQLPGTEDGWPRVRERPHVSHF